MQKKRKTVLKNNNPKLKKSTPKQQQNQTKKANWLPNTQEQTMEWDKQVWLIVSLHNICQQRKKEKRKQKEKKRERETKKD